MTTFLIEWPTLLEAEDEAPAGAAVCDKPPKGPKGDPVIKAWSVMELQRCTSSIIGRRNKLEKAVERLKKAEKKGNLVDIACGKLKIKASKDWLEFTTKRYVLLKDKLEGNGSPATQEKLAATIAWGDPIASGGVAHILQYDDEGALADLPNVAAPPDIPNFKFDFKNNKLLGPDGKEFHPGATVVPDSIGDPGAAAPPTPPETPPETPKTVLGKYPAGVSDATPGQLKIIKAKLKSGVFAMLKNDGYVNWEALNDGMKGLFAPGGDVMIGGLSELAQELKSKVEDLTMQQKLEFLEVAKKIVKEKAGEGKIKQVKELRGHLAGAGIWLPPKDVNALITSAQDSVAQATSFESYSAADQQTIKAILKKIATSEGGLTSGPAKQEVKWKLASAGLPLSSTAIAALGLGMAQFVVPEGKGLDYLGAGVQQAALEIGKAAHAKGENVADAVAGAGIAHLSLVAGAQLAEKIKGAAKPDFNGFLKDLMEVLKKVTVIELGIGVESLLNKHHPSTFLGLMSHHHVDWTEALKHKAKTAKNEEIKSRWNEGAAMALSVAKWDDIAQSMTPTKPGFVSSAKAVLWLEAEKVGFAGQSAHHEAHGHSVVEDIKPWYDAWLKQHEEGKKNKEGEPEKVSVSDPTPAAVAAPTTAPTQPAYTKFKKLSKPAHLTPEQAAHLEAAFDAAIMGGTVFTKTGKLKKQLGGIATKIRAEFKEAYAAAGVSGIGKFVEKMLADRITKFMATGLPDEADLKKQYDQVIGSGGYLPYALTNIAENVFTKKSYQGKAKANGHNPASWFASANQKSYFTSMLGAALEDMPQPSESLAPDPVTGMGGSYVGMTEPEMLSFVSLSQPALGPSAPAYSAFDGQQPKGSNGSHVNLFSSANEDGSVGGESHMWLHKTDHFGGISAWAEAAAIRGQALLGGGNTHAWVEPVGKSGQASLTSFFPQLSDLRHLEKSKQVAPWTKTYATDKTIKDLQRFHIINFLLEEKDDHGGNFVLDPKTGGLTGIDRGQAGKFFNSSDTLLSDLTWTVPAKAGFQDSGKGVPRKMLNAWASGETVAIASIMDPTILDVINRAEEITDEVWGKMWKPYTSRAEGGKLGSFSKKKKDKTSAGFIAGMNDRRKNIRAQVAAAYGSLCATRVDCLQAKGDKRPKDVILKEVEEQCGLDKFRDLKSIPKTSSPVINHDVVAASGDWDGDWDGKKLPKMSKLPTMAHLKSEGAIGTEFAVPSDDVKDGRVELVVLDDATNRVAAQFWMETGARAQLQSRLGWKKGGAGTAAPQKPSPPTKVAFQAPPPPSGLATKDDLTKQFFGASGVSSHQNPDGTPMPKVKKYIDKWAKKWTMGGSKGEKHMVVALSKARNMVKSKNPLEKAAGEHYEKELLRIGSETGAAGFTFTDPTNLSAAALKFKPFTPSAQMEKETANFQGSAQKEYEESIEDAKKEHAKNEVEKVEAHKVALESWKKKVATHKEKQKGLGLLEHKAHDHYKIPTASMPTAKWGQANRKMSWNGKHKKGGSIPDKHYEIDGGEGVKIFFVPGETSGKRSSPGVNGLTRIEFPKNQTREQIKEHMKRAAAILNVQLRPATSDDQELTYLRRMAWLRHLEGNGIKGMPEPAGTNKQKVDFWIKQFSKSPMKKSQISSGSLGGKYMTGGMGHDPRYVPEKTTNGLNKKVGGKVVLKKDSSGNLVKNPSYQPLAVDMGGRIANWRFDIDEAEIKKLEDEGKVLTHSIYGGSEGAEKILTSGVMLPNEQRQMRGISGKVGQSPGPDRRNGGSYENYFNTANAAQGGYGGGMLNMSIRLLGYTSTMSNTYHDPYGCKLPVPNAGSSGVLNRAASLKEGLTLVEVVEHIGGGETTVGSKVDLRRWLVSYKAPNGKKVQAQKMLKGHGVSDIGGKKVSDVVI